MKPVYNLLLRLNQMHSWNIISKKPYESRVKHSLYKPTYCIPWSAIQNVNNSLIPKLFSLACITKNKNRGISVSLPPSFKLLSQQQKKILHSHGYLIQFREKYSIKMKEILQNSFSSEHMHSTHFMKYYVHIKITVEKYIHLIRLQVE